MLYTCPSRKRREAARGRLPAKLRAETPRSDRRERLTTQPPLHSIAMNQPFVDGNKRTAFVAMDVFLRLNGMRPSEDEKYNFVMDVASGRLTFPAIVQWLSARVHKI